MICSSFRVVVLSLIVLFVLELISADFIVIRIKFGFFRKELRKFKMDFHIKNLIIIKFN